MSWYTSGQNDTNIRYFLLDSAHGAYESKRAIIQSLSPNYTLDNGAVANTKVVRGYVTDAEIASNGLDIGGCVLDRVHNFVNPNAAAVSIYTNAWGDKYPMWGQFLQQPQAIPTTPIDRLVQYWKDGLGSFRYVALTATGTGDGSSYANADGIIGVDTSADDNVIFCGQLGKATNTSITNLILKSGTSSARTQWFSHPVDTAKWAAGVRLGSNASGDGAFVNDTGNRWVTTNTTGAGGGAPFEQINFVLYWNGTAYVPITKVADAATVTSTTNSWYAEPTDATDGGSAGSKLWINIGGADPTNVVYFGGYAGGGGLNFVIASKSYFDITGIEFYQAVWNGVAQTNASNYAWYANKFGYATSGTGRIFGCLSGDINETTGDFTPDVQTDRSWIGNEVFYCAPFVYDANGGHDVVPERTLIRDNYCHDMNLVADEAYGVNLFSASDQHVFTSQGADDHLIENNTMVRVGCQPILHYLQPNRFTNPSGGLELTDLYVNGYKYPSKCWAYDATDSIYPCKLRNTRLRYNLIRDMHLGADYAPVDSQVIAFQGDDAQLLDYAGGQYDENEIAYNIVEGAAGGGLNGGAIRYRFCHAVESERASIHRNIVRGVDLGFHSLMNVSVHGGSTYNPSFTFGPGNDIHALDRFVQNSNILNVNHLFYFDGNTYRSDESATWHDGANTRTTLAAWQGAALSGDTHDPTSTHAALTTDTGSPTLTLSGTSVLTATLGTDPDGATSSLSYQHFKNGTLITSATSSTYDATGQTGNFTCVVLGTDAKGKWFLVTSNTVTFTSAGVPSGSGGIPLSEAEFYRKQKKNRPVVEDMDVAPQPVPVAVYTGVIERPKPPILRSSPELKASLERAEQIARERPKKRNRRKDDDWFILN